MLNARQMFSTPGYRVLFLCKTATQLSAVLIVFCLYSIVLRHNQRRQKALIIFERVSPIGAQENCIGSLKFSRFGTNWRIYCCIIA